MNEVTVTINVSDWRDVPVNHDEIRRNILERIAIAASEAADLSAERSDIAVQASYTLTNGEFTTRPVRTI